MPDDILWSERRQSCVHKLMDQRVHFFEEKCISVTMNIPMDCWISSPALFSKYAPVLTQSLVHSLSLLSHPALAGVQKQVRLAWLLPLPAIFLIELKGNKNHQEVNNSVLVGLNYWFAKNLHMCWHTNRYRKVVLCPRHVCHRWGRSMYCCHGGCIQGCRNTTQKCWHNDHHPGSYSHN